MTTPVTGKGSFCVPLTGALLFAGGEVGSAINPEGGSIIITRATIYTTTPSTGAANLSVGVAANATTSATTFLNAVDAIATLTAASALNCFAYGDPADSLPIMTSTQYITATGSASTVGFAGYLHVEYLHV
jgi:hypothetical protein